MANAWAVLARSLGVISARSILPVGSSEIIGHISQETLEMTKNHEAVYKNDSQRHVSVRHRNIGNSFLVEDGEIVVAKPDTYLAHSTYHSGNYVSVEEGTSRADSA